MLLQSIAIGRADDELVVDVPAIVGRTWKRDAIEQTGVAEQGAIAVRVGATKRGPAGQMRRLHAENRRLQGIHPEIRTDHLMVVPRLHAMRPQQPRLLREPLVVRRQQARVAEGAEILAGEK